MVWPGTVKMCEQNMAIFIEFIVELLLAMGSEQCSEWAHLVVPLIEQT